MPRKTKLTQRARPKMVRASEEMKRWAALLAEELSSWPRVSERPMFGFRSFYRGNQIFAAVPRTRAIGSPNSVIFRMPNPTERMKRRMQHDARIRGPRMGAKWIELELASADDINAALEWFGHAYEVAKRPRP